MVFVNTLLFLFGLMYSLSADADLIVPPAVEPGSIGFLNEHTSILWIAIVTGVVLLILVAYYMRKK